MQSLEEAITHYQRQGASVSLVSPHLQRKSWEDHLWTPIGSSVNPDSLAGLMRKGMLNSISMAAIRMIATSFPEAKLRVMRAVEGGEDAPVDHWLPQLFRNPNPYDTEFTVKEQIAADANMAGSYWELVRETDNPDAPVVEMHRLLPHTVRAVVAPDLGLIGYELTPAGGGEIKTLMPWEVLAVGFPSPYEHFQFWSPLQSAASELGIDLNLAQFMSNYFENGAVPGGLLTSEQSFSKEQVEPFIEKFKRVFSWRRRKSGEIGVLPNGIKYQQITPNFKDMDIENIIKLTEARICGSFGVDPVLIPTYTGMKEGGKYANYAEARAHLWDETLTPFGARLGAQLTKQLLAGEEGHYAMFDFSEVRALQEDENAKAGRAVSLKAGNVISLNEARALLGYDPVAGGEEVQPPEPPPEPPRKSLEAKAVAQFGRRLFDVHDRLVPDYQQAIAGVFDREKKLLASNSRAEKT